MTWLRWFAVGLIVGLAVLAAAVWHAGGASGRLVTDFVARIDEATVKRPREDVFAVRDVTIGGEVRSSIAMTQASRLAWNVTPAAGQWVEVDAGLREEGWTSDANAVLFRVGLSFDGHYEDLVAKAVNPAGSAGDRRWVPIRIDLSPYAGRVISLILNTAPAPGVPAGHVHHAVWGAPALVQR